MFSKYSIVTQNLVFTINYTESGFIFPLRPVYQNLPDTYFETFVWTTTTTYELLIVYLIVSQSDILKQA